MAQVTISQLPQAQPLTGTETVPINQNGLTVQATVADIANSPTQQQSFITATAEPTLPNYRQLSGSIGIGLSDGGSQGQMQITLNGVSGSLEVSTDGLISKSGGSVVGRTITGSSTGVVVTNGDGVLGNPVVALTGPVGTINGLSGNGIMALTAGGSVGAVNILGTADEIVVVNGDGQGNPTIGIADNPVIPGVEGVVVPIGSTGDRGAAVNGTLRYNTDTATFEGYANNAWGSIAAGSGVTSINASGGTTGMTFSGGPITSSGTLTLGGTLDADNGGTGLSSYAAGDILYASGATTISKLGIGANTFVMTSNGASPVWTAPSSLSVGYAATAGTATSAGTATNLAGGAANRIAYQSGAGMTTFINAPTSPNTYLQWSGSAFTWATAASGTVTSVGLALPAEFTISNSPVTTTGTLTGAWASQTANYVLAAPNGTAGTPSFRALTATDVPTAGSVSNSVTFNTSGGASPGTSFNGSAARTVDYSTVGAPKADGTGASGTWGISITGNAATATNVAGGNANQIVYQTGAGTSSFIVAPTVTDTFLKWNGSSFAWAVNPLGTVTSVGTGTGLTGGPITTTGTINFSNAAVGTWAATPSSANLAAAMTDETGSGSLVFANSPTLSGPTIDGANPYVQFANGAAVTLAAGKMWYDGATGAWNLGMGNGNITQQVGEEFFCYGKASAAISDVNLQLIYKTGVVGASGVITFAPSVAGITDPDQIIGIATESIALNGFGRVTTMGVVNGINTTGSVYGETWADNDDIWYNPVTGGLTKIKPVAPNIKLQVGTVINAGSGGSGSFSVKLGSSSALGGTDSNVQFGTLADKQLLQYDSTAGYWKNVAPSSVTGVGSVVNAVTFNTTGGAAPNTTFDGSAARTIDYSTVGAPKADGTGASGTWSISINGNAATATTATSATTATTATQVSNSVTFNTSGGAAAGSSFNGSAARTVDYSTVGAPSATGTGASGTWSISINGNAATATSATNATNATNVAVTADATNATRYIGFYSATTGNVGTLVDADITYNPSTNTLTTASVVATTGISGGTF